MKHTFILAFDWKNENIFCSHFEFKIYFIIIFLIRIYMYIYNTIISPYAKKVYMNVCKSNPPSHCHQCSMAVKDILMIALNCY